MTTITIPDFSLVVLVGPTGCGKSTFARKHFLETEIISSDECRAIVSDDETDQSSTPDAFDLLHYTAGLRLKRRKLTVIDSTAVQKEARADLIKLARKYHALPVALVLDIHHDICHERNQVRENRNFGPQVSRNHSRALKRGLKFLKKDGFAQYHIMKTPEEVEALQIERVPLYNDKRTEAGPFDIIGDIHGCFEETTELLEKLGYVIHLHEKDSEDLISVSHPEGRIAVFVGDITDRGPYNKDCLRLVMGMIEQGTGQCVIGNHDYKLQRWLRGKNIKIAHGLELTIKELEASSSEFRNKVEKFIDGLISHHWYDEGKLVVAHAGLKEEMHGRGSSTIRSFAMYGDTTGEVDDYGLPVRLNWAKDYRGQATVVYGHTPTPEAEWLNETICIDTGCVFGGKLTALRWPEREQVSVPAKKQYSIPKKPLGTTDNISAQQEHDRVLYFDELIGKKRIDTRYGNTVLVPAENSAAALEVMSRFAIDPRWLIYLPPTMAPPPTTQEGEYLEHPNQAIEYFIKRGISDLIAEEKHMGSRALLIICRNEEAAIKRFGIEENKAGIIYTRTGRPFFKCDELERNFISRIQEALDMSKFWDTFQSDWFLLDTELMPWSAKAQDLLNRQYGPTAEAAYASSSAILETIHSSRKVEGLDALQAKASLQKQNAIQFQETMEGYCWEAESLEDYKLAPFHILASEGHVHTNQPHHWHMEMLSKLSEHEPIIIATKWKRFNASKQEEVAEIINWWKKHTQAGQEGLVIKPNNFIAKGETGYVQPAMKVRGKDYLRIIYGPDYDLPENIERLRQRGLSRKWSLAMREFSLGMEGLHRFVERKPLAKIHECTLGVLALESEPVDPRL